MIIGLDRPMDGVLLGFCLSLALAVARTHAPLLTFYSWFNSCGLQISNHRGYGQSACKAFGEITQVLKHPSHVRLTRKTHACAQVSSLLPSFRSWLCASPDSPSSLC